MPGKALGCRDLPILGVGSPIGEHTGHLLSEHQCWPSLCDAEAVSFLLFHIKRTNMVLEGVESSLRQEELSDK